MSLKKYINFSSSKIDFLWIFFFTWSTLKKAAKTQETGQKPIGIRLTRPSVHGLNKPDFEKLNRSQLINFKISHKKNQAPPLVFLFKDKNYRLFLFRNFNPSPKISHRPFAPTYFQECKRKYRMQSRSAWTYRNSFQYGTGW